uniref:Cell number regulator 2-like n=1 Tax=Ananas comosus var. bracteatus TaxID=296719 RepID=A0A6V7P7Q8_ANACO|nr:unnamed protein product [Ananas comosus var. bracteatus]
MLLGHLARSSPFALYYPFQFKGRPVFDQRRHHTFNLSFHSFLFSFCLSLFRHVSIQAKLSAAARDGFSDEHQQRILRTVDGAQCSRNPYPPESVAWSTGLCDCCDDVSNCCMTCFCPCVTFGKIAEIVDKGSSSCGTSGALYTLIMCVTGCQCLYSCFYRSKMRALYSLQKRPCGDCCVHCFCEQCALCQEYRELKRRGFDMEIGWLANMEKQGYAAPTMPMPPPTQQGMTR